MKPILFNTAMVQAILEGRKTCTRRIIKGVEGLDFIGFVSCCTSKENEGKATFGHGSFEDIVNAKIEKYIKPPYRVGDIIYVRETWMLQSMKNFDKKIKFLFKAEPNEILNEVKVSEQRYDDLIKFESKTGWQPSLFMPKEAARIFLKVTDVRVGKLQDIKNSDAINEGFCDSNNLNEHGELLTARGNFSRLWDSTLKKDQTEQYGWNVNPLVWVIEFERCEKNGIKKRKGEK